MRLTGPLICVALLWATSCCATATKNDTQFVATDEWQEIQEGQSIPQGLHVRINLQTGKKEAKLLEKGLNDSSSSASSTAGAGSLSTVPGESLQDHGGPDRVSQMNKLKEALQRIPTDDFKFDEQELKKVKAKYKSYDEIKKELKEANLEVKTDADIMGELFEKFEVLKNAGNLADSSSKSQLQAIFEDLQYLVHQIDNAMDFIDRQGIEKIIWPALNQTDTTLKMNGFKLLGTVVQNNPKAKVALFERNGGGILLTKLSQSSNSGELFAGLFAFGSLLRKFPYAQTELLTPNGYSLLFEILNKKFDLRVKLRIIKLITDLVQDYEHALNAPEVDTLTRERYQSTDLKQNLRKADYCSLAGQFFHQNKAAFVQDESLAEEVVSSLQAVSGGLCADEWSQCPLFRHTLLVLRNTLDTRLSDGDGDDAAGEDRDSRDYLLGVQRQIVHFIEELYEKPSVKDEL